jgi:hypothetical protein
MATENGSQLRPAPPLDTDDLSFRWEGTGQTASRVG